jgi:alginate O-acetyltransferase complex protein AlgI
MLFNSYEFIFLFLPIVFLGFFCLARFSFKIAALWLALASVFFYGWWAPEYVVLLLSSVVFNYGAGYLISYSLGAGRHARLWLVIAVAANLGLLGFYKYANFFIDTTNSLAGADLTLVEIILPLGISFFTFTQIAFLVDAYRGIAREYNFVHYLLFVTYFPHLIAGPVLHHAQMMPQFAERKTYSPQLNYIAIGLSVFTIGLAKKVLLADNFSVYAEPVFAAASLGVQPDLISAWAGTLAYTLQLYFDFSGYSDMAIGISLLFGVKLPINFNSPYKAANIIEFWRRWHMTLSQFLRDYLYVPLGGNRNGPAMRHVNLMITMLLGGLWHGASWTFVMWGGLHGLFLIVNHAWRKVAHNWLPSSGISAWFYMLASTLLTFFCVVIAWIFFRAESFDSAMLILRGCFGYGGISMPSSLSFLAERWPDLGNTLVVDITFGGAFLNIPGMGSLGGIVPFIKLLFLGLVIVWFAPNCQQFFKFIDEGARKGTRWLKWAVSQPPKPLVGFLIGCLFCFGLGKLDKVSSFLYYQF